MNNDIALRGYGISTKKWEFFTVYELLTHVQYSPYSDYTDVDLDSIQRYIGIDDKNSNGIYEGDIVQYNQNSSYDGIDFIVQWSDESLGWILKSESGEVLTNEWTPNGPRYSLLEVVGNIYNKKIKL